MMYAINFRAGMTLLIFAGEWLGFLRGLTFLFAGRTSQVIIARIANSAGND